MGLQWEKAVLVFLLTDQLPLSTQHMNIVLMRRDSANKNKELSLLVSVMGCPQERRLFINIYHWFGAKKDFQIFVSMEVHNW